MNNKYKNTTYPAAQQAPQDGAPQTGASEKDPQARRGKLYGVGTGPGRPELMTVLAVETIKKCPVIAVPTAQRESAASYRTAAAMIPEISERYCLTLDTPMTKNLKKLDEAYHKSAETVIERLDRGDDVAYLVLGDPAVYSTYIYIHRIVSAAGYDTEIISGVTSFCAAAAALGDSLVDRSEQLHIIPSSYDTKEALKLPGTKILMKTASRMKELKNELKAELDSCGDTDINAAMVENCGMPDERIYKNLDDIPKEAGYFSTIIVSGHKRY